MLPKSQKIRPPARFVTLRQGTAAETLIVEVLAYTAHATIWSVL